MEASSVFYQLVIFVILFTLTNQQTGRRRSEESYRCYSCGSSDLTSAKCGERETPTTVGCCQDPFDHQLILNAMTDRTPVGNEGIVEDCELCLKIKYSWKWRRPDVYYKRICVVNGRDKAYDELMSILDIRYNADKWWPDTPREDRWRSNQQVKDLKALQNGACLRRTEETAVHDLFLDICSCKGDLCNGAISVRMSAAMLFVTFAFIMML
ncbi:PREDICTED: uncharacterized protein LOC106813113 [Priapulus caudatus]|uniref:Uncharacterized protein LOC106813113 n=1 Tax=Priapulus caudatus TaxID=37621 RepID=A0ABM1EKD4_PRICU|nr:PREDICTED: uncharacterized protein LOC106813113 [Priapulus caudatus]